MTTFTTEDREAYKKMLEEAPAHIGYEDAVVNVQIEVEPIPFMGLVDLTDHDDKETMLREQIRMQQNEIGRLKTKLAEHGIND